MPTYNFQSKSTGEITERVMSFSSRQQYLSENPDLEVVLLQAPPIGDAWRLGLTKPGGEIKDVLRRVHEKSPGSKLKETSSVQF